MDLVGGQTDGPVYRLVTTLLDPTQAPALAALNDERWEIETAFDELKVHLRGRAIVLRSRTPDLGCQEFYALVLAHYPVRDLMHDAALRAQLDPDEVSFVQAIRVARRKLPQVVAFSPQDDLPTLHQAIVDEILEERVSSSRGRFNPWVVKRKMSNFPTKSRSPHRGTLHHRPIIRIRYVG